MGTPANLNQFWAELLVEELIRNGVTQFFIAPGSRSTPLTSAVARHPRTEALVHFDERGSAFATLGYGRANASPAAWITTSGTAVANGLPAVVEASIDGVPMICLTADRPPELRDTSANQTINQVGIFGGYPRWFFDMPCPSEAIDPSFVLTTVDQAVFRSMQDFGPVHLNCMYREPLASVRDDSDLRRLEERLAPWRNSAEPFTTYAETRQVTSERVVDDIIARIESAVCPLLLLGRMNRPLEREVAARLAQLFYERVLADVLSGQRLGGALAAGPRPPALVMIQGSGGPGMAPMLGPVNGADFILQLGDSPVSKSATRFLTATRGVVFVVADGRKRVDPDHLVDRRVEADPSMFAEQLVLQSSSLGRSAISTHVDSTEDVALGDPETTGASVARAISRHIPPEHGLFLASSLAIRHMDDHAVYDGPSVRVAANRGASGIDGTIASAVGFGIGLGAPVTVLIGDLAALHDLNSMALLSEHPVVVVVLNDDGGGIFKRLPIAEESDVFEAYFRTPHGLGFAEAASMFGIDYHAPATNAEFAAVYERACGSDRSALIEVPIRDT